MLDFTTAKFTIVKFTAVKFKINGKVTNNFENIIRLRPENQQKSECLTFSSCSNHL